MEQVRQRAEDPDGQAWGGDGMVLVPASRVQGGRAGGVGGRRS